MDSKRVWAVIFSLFLIFSLTACKGGGDASVTQESTTVSDEFINETVAETVLNTDVGQLNTTSQYYVQETSRPSSSGVSNGLTETAVDTTSVKTENITTEVYDDPSEWSKERIVDEYKKAAKQSHSTAKSTQSIVLKEISVNNGEHDNVFSFIKPIIAKFIESNSTEKDGITGGFDNLVAKDVHSAKAYKSDKNVVIEMTMVEQTSGAKEDAFSGSVGHAITTVGDISEVVRDLEELGLPLELSEENTKIYYTNPTVNVVIDESGKIISGTWSYTVEIKMNNFKAFGKNVEKASIIMGNTITV